jgi:hypothetical protein
VAGRTQPRKHGGTGRNLIRCESICWRACRLLSIGGRDRAGNPEPTYEHHLPYAFHCELYFFNPNAYTNDFRVVTYT